MPVFSVFNELLYPRQREGLTPSAGHRTNLIFKISALCLGYVRKGLSCKTTCPVLYKLKKTVNTVIFLFPLKSVYFGSMYKVSAILKH